MKPFHSPCLAASPCSLTVIRAAWVVVCLLAISAGEGYASPPPERLTDRACGDASGIGTPPISLAEAVDRFNTADRRGGPKAFDAARRALSAVPDTDPVVGAYARLLRAVTRVRYLEGKAKLDAVFETLGRMDQAGLCRLRGLMEDDRYGARLKGVFAYDPATVAQMGRQDPAQVDLMLSTFARLGDVFHRIGARQHFFAVTYDFADVFEPIRDELPADVARQLSGVKTTFGKQHARLFSDLPSAGKHTSE